MYTIASGDILVLVTQYIACGAFGDVLARPMQIGEDQCRGHTQFVGVCLLRITRVAIAYSPVVRSVGLDGKSLVAPEQVLDGRFDGQVRTYTVVRAICHTGIGRQVVGAEQGVATVCLTATPVLRGTHAEAVLV